MKIEKIILAVPGTVCVLCSMKKSRYARLHTNNGMPKISSTCHKEQHQLFVSTKTHTKTHTKKTFNFLCHHDDDDDD